MPDAHWGVALTVGSVIATKGAIKSHASNWTGLVVSDSADDDAPLNDDHLAVGGLPLAIGRAKRTVIVAAPSKVE